MDDHFQLKMHALATAMRLADMRAAHGAQLPPIGEILADADKMFDWARGSVPPAPLAREDLQ